MKYKRIRSLVWIETKFREIEFEIWRMHTEK